MHTYISMLVSLVAVAAMATLGEPSPTVTEGIVLIGAGFGRTGTASTKKALELLDIGPTHHMVEVTSCTVCVYIYISPCRLCLHHPGCRHHAYTDLSHEIRACIAVFAHDSGFYIL